MKNYTKEEIEKIVSELSEKILQEHAQEIADEISNRIQGKSQSDAIIGTIGAICRATQDNSAQLIIETLDKLIND